MRKRTIIINGRFLTDPNSAVNAVALNLTKALTASADRSGWKVRLGVPKPLENHARQLTDAVISIGQMTGAAWDQVYFPQMRPYGVPVGLFNSVALRGRGYVTMLHDAHVFRTPQSYGFTVRKWRQILSKRAGVVGNRVLTVSEHSKQALLDLGIGKEDTIGVVPNGPSAVIITPPDPRILNRLGLHAGQPFCLGFSSLLPHKNIPFLMAVFREQHLKDVPLVLVGGTSKADFEKAGVPVPDHVRFAGRCTDAELAALYQAARTVAIPSLEEGFGLPALEALYFGKHPVVSPFGALPEVVGNAGRVVELDTTDWAEHIAEVCNQVDANTDIAKQQADRFTWSAAADLVWQHLDRWDL